MVLRQMSDFYKGWNSASRAGPGPAGHAGLLEPDCRIGLLGRLVNRPPGRPHFVPQEIGHARQPQRSHPGSDHGHSGADSCRGNHRSILEH